MQNINEAHAHFARTFNMEVWKLLTIEGRSPDENERMIGAAHASFAHWRVVGGSVEQQRGLWLISHVYAELEIAEPALRFAQRCLELTEAHPDAMKDFDLAYAFEGMARAAAVSGDRETALEYRERAAAAGEEIANDEDRKIFTNDLAGWNWGVLAPTL